MVHFYQAALFTHPDTACQRPKSTALLQVDFGSRSQSRVPNFYSQTSKTMVLQTTTRGVGRVQKIQNGTILEKLEKKILKRPLLS